MPYIRKKEGGVLKEERALIERDLCFLAKRICEIARLYREASEARLPIYSFVCFKLARSIKIEKRYGYLSLLQNTFGNAASEYCRKKKIQPDDLAFVDTNYPALNKRIAKLAAKINGLSAKNKEPHLVWSGILNYCYCTLGLKITDDPKNNTRFAGFIAGTLKYLYNRFYELDMAPYENEAEEKNGSVFPE